jgi:hypothetical protein
VPTLYASTDQTDRPLRQDPLPPATDADADADASADTDTAVDTVGAGVPIKVSQGWPRASHRIYALRVELPPMPFPARRGERIKLEITNHHDRTRTRTSTLRPHERPHTEN